MPRVHFSLNQPIPMHVLIPPWPVTKAIHSAEERKYERFIAHFWGGIFKFWALLQEKNDNTKTIKLEDAPEELQLVGILPIIQLGTIYPASNEKIALLRSVCIIFHCTEPGVASSAPTTHSTPRSAFVMVSQISKH